jgi:rhamnulokinase
VVGANFIAVDLGASSGRVVSAEWDGSAFRLRELHRFDNEPVTVRGHVHWDVLRLWHEIKVGLTKYAQSGTRPLTGIGVDTWGVDYALLDAGGKLLGNPYHYRDGRNDGMVELACQRIPRQEIYAQTGIQFMQLNSLTQLLSLAEAKEPQLEHAATLLMMPDLFNYWLTGRKVSEYTAASTSQLLHAEDRRWATELAAALELPTDIFPEIVSPGTVLGPVSAEVCEEMGFAHEVPVVAVGSHDTASAVVAVPELDEHSVYLSSGTWSLIGVEIPEPILTEEALRFNFTNEGGVGGTIRLLKNVAGLWLLQESRHQWQREGRDYDWGELLDLAGQAEPFRSLLDPDAPDFLSHGDIPGAIRAYCRHTGQPEPEGVGAVVRCCLESLALRYRWVVEALETVTGRALTTVRVVGGGSQNHLLNQFTADACGRPVVAGPVEATALGNVVMQAIATGHISDLAAGRRAVAASVELDRYAPEPSPEWDQAFERFKALLG